MMKMKSISKQCKNQEKEKRERMKLKQNKGKIEQETLFQTKQKP